MGRYKRLTDYQRDAAALLAHNGHTNRQIAAAVGANQATVAKVAARVRRTGVLEAPKSTGRPPLLDARDRRRLVRMVLTHDDLELHRIVALFNLGMPRAVSVRTVRRVLHDAGVMSARRRSKPFVSAKNRSKRLAWAKLHREWTDEWRNVFFTDESSFLVKSGRRPLYWTRRGSPWHPSTSLPSFKSGRQSVMVWGGFSYRGRTDLVWVDGSLNALSYQDQVLEVAYNYIMADFGSTKDVVLQEDLAPPHNARSTRLVERELGLKVLPWVGQSPDLNPIENAWAELERRLRRRKVVPKNKAELFGALQEKWRAIPDAYFEKLADTMKHRCAAVVQVNGWPTKY
ncbi:hypothetical protein I4F81_009814 [Pyropia yezoensis]|uniref:Uncharacterized protein n=1 Tax=Pyropia yezoensis TaxID=2788 RepID=A0ACC3CAW1_PYRYE|nr:hypothetical protein I4F81_009814 [Neopyropia yezoensis]